MVPEATVTRRQKKRRRLRSVDPGRAHNYLDREGLGALVLAIKGYRGGVLIISHNKEFCDCVATEKWVMNKGMLRIEGESVAKEEEKQAGNKQQEDVYDAVGNKIDVKRVDALSDKGKKKASGPGEETDGGQEEEEDV